MTPARILDRAMAAKEQVFRDDDQWLAYLDAECAKALAAHLQAACNLNRPIASLTRAEMMAAAQAVTAHWIGLVSRRIGDAHTEKQQEYVEILMAG